MFLIPIPKESDSGAMNCDARHVLFSKQSGWYLARGTNIYFIFPLPLKRNVVSEVSFDFLSKLKLNLFKIPYENIFHRDNHINSSYRHSSLSLVQFNALPILRI